jgi:hypothetical protein
MDKAESSSSGANVSRLRFARGRTFACPAELKRVWPVFRDVRRWYTEYDWLVVDGPPYGKSGGLAEGQTVEVRFGNRAASLGRTPLETIPSVFLTEMLKVRDYEIVSALAGETEEWTRYTQFYVWRLAEAGAETKITIESYTEMALREPMGGAQRGTYEDDLFRNWNESWETALEGLTRTMAADG